MSDLIILKLGGSVITAKKSGKPIVNVRTVRRLAKEIQKWRSSTNGRQRLVLLYGGGSFGHPLAHRYRLQHTKLTKQAFIGVGKTIVAIRELGNLVSRILLQEGIPVVPLQTSSMAQMVAGRVVFSDHSLITHILSAGGVPFLGGDVVVSDGRRSAIASADVLAVSLARHFRARKVLFATDVDGVYKHFPPRRGELPLQEIHRNNLRALITSKQVRPTRDVTGAMGGKLKALLPLRNCEVVIFNALISGILGSVLRGRSHGSEIVL